MASSRSATSSSLTSAPTCVPRIASTRSCAEVLEPLALDLIQGRWELVYRCRYLLIFGGGPGYEAHGLGRAAATSWSSLCTAPSRSAISSSTTATPSSAWRTAPTRSCAEVLESMPRDISQERVQPPDGCSELRSFWDVLGFEAHGLARAPLAPQPLGLALCGAKLR